MGNNNEREKIKRIIVRIILVILLCLAIFMLLNLTVLDYPYIRRHHRKASDTVIYHDPEATITQVPLD